MMTEVHACMSRKWALRMSIVTLAFTLFGMWCIYDAKVTYPRFNASAEAHNRLLSAGRRDQWPALAKQKGWDPHFFKEDDRTASGMIITKTAWDVGTQYLMMGACFLAAAITASRILRARKRVLHANDDGFLTLEGALVPYDSIDALDMSRWQRKSIVTVHYRVQNTPRRTRIDDWIYEGGEAILNEIRRRTGLGETDDPTSKANKKDENTPAKNGETATDRKKAGG